ncbi:MAG: DUF2849 domain-containing protein, partial [Rhodoplanes sp.]
ELIGERAMTETRKTEEAAVISAARGGRGAALKAATGNRLSDGAVVYLGDDGEWTERIEGARIADGKDAAAALIADAERDVPLCRVVAPYLIDIARGPDDAVRPATYRERIRAFGPSIHPRFGGDETGS